MKSIVAGKREGRRIVASALLTLSLLPMATPFAAAQTAMGQTGNPALRSSAGKKLVLVGGAALLYYLYKRHQASVAANPTTGGRMAGAPAQASVGRAQLYRSKNGGIYYRDAQKRAVWLTVPTQGVQVSSEELQRYAPDYSRYRGNAPATPRGYRSQPFSQFDPSLMGGSDRPQGSMADPVGAGGSF